MKNWFADHQPPIRATARRRAGFFGGEWRVSTRTKPSRRKNGYPDQNTLSDIVRRVVEAAQPDKIVLFGSAARGEMGPDSDIDLLVIKGGRFNRWRLTTAIYRHLRGKGAPVDVVLVTPEEVARYGDSPYLVIRSALSGGKVVYGA
jgi:predicted nucleotidyltransferase